jgi:hypothetical protein
MNALSRYRYAIGMFVGFLSWSVVGSILFEVAPASIWLWFLVLPLTFGAAVCAGVVTVKLLGRHM